MQGISDIHRNELARRRTLYANERTFLSYVRTSIELFLLMIAMVRFFSNPVVIAFGTIAGIFAVGFLVYGLHRFRRRKREISNRQRQ